MISRRTLGPAIAAVVCIGVAGCGATTDKAGGRQAGHPLVLHVLNTRSAGEVQPFVDKLTAVSKGMLQLKVEDKWERGSPTADADVIGAIQAGAADLGIDAARAWRGVGVTSFDALVAPMAIDSMALQEKVLAGNLPGEMLPALTPLGLDGMGILPGPMHKPGGITRTLLSPADYKGARMGVGASVVVDRAVRTLGAVPVASGFEGPAPDLFSSTPRPLHYFFCRLSYYRRNNFSSPLENFSVGIKRKRITGGKHGSFLGPNWLACGF